MIPDAEQWRQEFVDGYATTTLVLDPGGRIRVYGYDGDDLVHCTSHSPETAEEMADLLSRMAIRSRGER